jgi:multisubunit Na+/H+ antiporter MnhF subunit
MSGRKVAVAISLGALFGCLVVASIVMILVAIWTGDERWGSTALVLGGVGFVGAIGTATYPGWDW